MFQYYVVLFFLFMVFLEVLCELRTGRVHFTLYDDILMTSQQRSDIFGSDDVTGSRTRPRRSVRSGENYRWDLPIRYQMDGNFEFSERILVQRALREWQMVTCIQFSELPPGRTYHKPFILFKKGHDYICTSYVGNQQMTQGQPVLLGSRCFEQVGRLLHELGHVLGLLHEHMRSNRDDYVIIRAPKSNINFEKAATESEEDFGVAYDFNSVMHYPVMNTENYELKPKDPRYQQNLGQRELLSFLDARKINLAYCQASCLSSIYPAPLCQHGGYRHPTRCYKCLCPDGFGGLTCRQPARHRRAQCGGDYELTDDVPSHVVHSPGYFERIGYKLGTECNWVIMAANNSRVALEFRGDFIVPSESGRTCDSWVEVTTGQDLSKPGYRFCGDKAPTRVFLSEGSEITVVLKSSRHLSHRKSHDTDHSQRRQKRGFLAYVWKVSG